MISEKLDDAEVDAEHKDIIDELSLDDGARQISCGSGRC